MAMFKLVAYLFVFCFVSCIIAQELEVNSIAPNDLAGVAVDRTKSNTVVAHEFNVGGVAISGSFSAGTTTAFPISLRGLGIDLEAEQLDFSATNIDIQSVNLEFSTESYAVSSPSIALTSTVGDIDFQATEAVEVSSYISNLSTNTVSLESGAASAKLTAAEKMVLESQDLDVLATNDIQTISNYDVSLLSSISFEVTSNLVDFDAAADLAITSGTANIKLDAGQQLTLEGKKITVSAENGLHFESQRGVLSFTAEKLFNLDAQSISNIFDNIDIEVPESLTVAATDVTVNSGRESAFYTTGPITFTANNTIKSTAASAIDFAALKGISFAVKTSTVKATQSAVSAGNLAIASASDATFSSASSIYLVANEKIQFNTDNSAETIKFDAKNDVTHVAPSISVETPTDAIPLTASQSINLKANTGYDDIVSVTSLDDVTLQSVNGAVAFTFGHYAAQAKASHDLSSTTTLDLSAGGSLQINTAKGVVQKSKTWTIKPGKNNDSPFVFKHTAATNFPLLAKAVTLSSTVDDVSFSTQQTLAVTATNSDLLLQPKTAQIFVAPQVDLTAAKTDIIFTIGQYLYTKSFGVTDINPSTLTTVQATNDISLRAVGNIALTEAKGPITFSQQKAGTFTKIVSQDDVTITANTGAQLTAGGAISFATSDMSTSSDVKLIAAEEVVLTHQNINVHSFYNTKINAGEEYASISKTLVVSNERERDIYAFSRTKATTFTAGKDITATSDGNIAMTSTGNADASGNSVVLTSRQNLDIASKANIAATAAKSLTVVSAGDIYATSNQGAAKLQASSIFYNMASSFRHEGSTATWDATNTTHFVTADAAFTAPLDTATTIKTTSTNFTLNGNIVNSSGGTVTVAGTSGVFLRGHHDVILTGTKSSLLSTIKGNITMLGQASDNLRTNDRILVKGNDTIITGFEGGVDLQAATGSIVVRSSHGDNINFKAKNSVFFTSNNDKDIVVTTGAADSLFTANTVNLIASNTLFNGNVISKQNAIELKGERGVSLSSSAQNLLMQAKSKVTFTATKTCSIFGNNVNFQTTATATTAGGISVATTDSVYDNAYGRDVGIGFVTGGASGTSNIRVESLVGKNTFSAFSIDLVSNEGRATLFAGDEFTVTAQEDDITFRALDSTNTIQAIKGNVALKADDDVLITATESAIFRAKRDIHLLSTEKITDPSLVGIEVAADGGHITLSASHVSADITWKADRNIVINSGAASSYTAGDVFKVTSTEYTTLHGHRGLTINVKNGDYKFDAEQGIAISSSNANEVAFYSGDSISQTSGLKTTVNVGDNKLAFVSVGSDITIETVDSGRQLYTSSANIILSADGTDTAKGGGIDGIFVTGNNIDQSAQNGAAWEVAKTLTVGLNTIPTVTISSGGDGDLDGFDVAAAGTIKLKAENSIKESVGDRLVFKAGYGGIDWLIGQGLQIISVGTSDEGKDVTMSTNQNFDITATTSFDASATERFDMKSNEAIVIQSTLASAAFKSANKLEFEVSAIYQTLAQNWNLNAQTVDFEAAADIVFANAVGTGKITVEADSLLSMSSDIDWSLTSANTVTVETQSSNSKIVLQTRQETSQIIVTAKDDFTATANSNILLSGPKGINIAAIDNTVAGTSGTITTSVPSGQFEMGAKGSINIVGKEGVSFETANNGKRDIEVTAGGKIEMDARLAATFTATNEILISTTEGDITFATHVNETGDINFSATEDITFISTAATTVINATDDISLNSGELFTLKTTNEAGQVLKAGALFSLQQTGVMTIDSQKSGINFFSKDSSFIDSSEHLKVTANGAGRVILQADATVTPGALTITSKTEFSPIKMAAADQIHATIAGTTQISATGKTEGQGEVLISAAKDITITGQGNNNIKFASTADNTDFYANNAQTYTVATTAKFTGDGLLFEARQSASSLIQFSSSADIDFTAPAAAGDVIISTKDNRALSTINLESSTMTLTLGAGTAQTCLHAESPNAASGIFLDARHFIDGNINFADPTHLVLEGYERVEIQTQDDDEADANPSTIINGINVDLIGRGGDLNDVSSQNLEGVVFESSIDGYVVATAKSLSVAASDKIIVANKQLMVFQSTNNNVAFTAENGISFASTLNTAISTTTNNIVLDAGKNLKIIAPNTNTITVNSKQALKFINTISNAAAPKSFDPQTSIRFESRGNIKLSGQGKIQLTAAPEQVVSVAPHAVMKIPALYSRDKFNALSTTIKTGAACADAGAAIEDTGGGLNSFFYEAKQANLCFCSSSTSKFVCFATAP